MPGALVGALQIHLSSNHVMGAIFGPCATSMTSGRHCTEATICIRILGLLTKHMSPSAETSRGLNRLQYNSTQPLSK